MNCLIVTGLSGAGKSLAVHALEDIGFYCVDNLPPALITKFTELAAGGDKVQRRLAIVCDVRGGADFGSLFAALADLKAAHVDYKILFLEARPDVLERRFKETRRRHPLAMHSNVATANAIELEQKILAPLYETADFILDTSILSTAQLREAIVSLFATENSQGMQLKLMSFGFKYGTPQDADIVFDVRCVPNPFYVPELKELTGKDDAVVQYIFSTPDSAGLLERLLSLLDFAIPLYSKEGKSQLTVAIGCTGGHHRSVAYCEAIARHFEGCNPYLIHRDIGR